MIRGCWNRSKIPGPRQPDLEGRLVKPSDAGAPFLSHRHELPMNPPQAILAIDAAWAQRRRPCSAARGSLALHRFLPPVTGVSPNRRRASRATGPSVALAAVSPIFLPYLRQQGDLRVASRISLRSTCPSPGSTRRPTDRAVFREFGSRHCAAHSPSAACPGPRPDRLELTGLAKTQSVQRGGASRCGENAGPPPAIGSTRRRKSSSISPDGLVRSTVAKRISCPWIVTRSSTSTPIAGCRRIPVEVWDGGSRGFS